MLKGNQQNVTASCDLTQSPTVFLCDSYYATTYIIWVLQTITLLSTSDLVIGSSGIILSGVVRVVAFTMYDTYFVNVLEFIWQDAMFHFAAILALREVEINSQEYFFALKHRRKRFVELME